MFARPGLCGMGIGRLGLVAASQPSLVAQALAILAKYGSAANLYLPGVGAINGITAGNWLDTVGGTPATVDGAVGTVVSARGGVNLTQSTAANRPVLRRGLVNLFLRSNDLSAAAWIKYGSTSATSPTTISLPNYNQSIYQAYSVSARPGDKFSSSFLLSGVGTIYIFVARNTGGAYEETRTKITLTPTPTLYTVTHTLLAAQTSMLAGLSRASDGTATEVTCGMAGFFTGTVTTSQILAAGGIPLTTTAPASSTSGPFAWQFDGNNDSFASTMTTGNEGWVCAGTNVQALNPAGAMFVGNGAFSATGSPGMMIYSHGAGGGGFMQLWLSNGVSRQFVGSTVTPIGSAFVFDGGWDASSAAIAINGVEQNLVKTIDPTSAQTIRIGIDPGLFWMLNGLIFATVIMPTVLPTATERATLRQFIASLSGVTI